MIPYLFRLLDILVRISAIDLILEDSSSFNHHFEILVSILNTSVRECFVDDNQLYLPDFITHVKECSCNYCTNPKLQDFHIKLYLHYINGRKSFHNAKQSEIDNYKEAIDSLTSNADSRYQSNLTSVKQLIGYKDHVTPVKRRGKRQKKTGQTIIECPTFSKYIAHAKLIGENSIAKSTTMISNIEQLISKLESNVNIKNSSHDFQRLVAQLYYLRSILYLDSNITDSKKEPPVADNVSLEEAKPVTRKTRGRGTSQRKTTTRRKKKTEEVEDDEICQQLDGINLEEKKTNEPLMKINDVHFLEDLKKVLSTLNAYTDTLIIKSIYELISFVTAMKEPELAVCTQFLSSSRTLHQQILNSIGKKLRLVSPFFNLFICLRFEH